MKVVKRVKNGRMISRYTTAIRDLPAEIDQVKTVAIEKIVEIS